MVKRLKKDKVFQKAPAPKEADDIMPSPKLIPASGLLTSIVFQANQWGFDGKRITGVFLTEIKDGKQKVIFSIDPPAETPTIETPKSKLIVPVK